MISIIKKFNRIMDRRQKSRIGVLFVVTVISALLEVLGVSLIIPIITAIMDPNIIYKNGIIVEICKVLDLHSHRTFAVFCIGMLVIVFVFKSFFLMFSYYLQARFVYNNRYATSRKLFHIFISRPYEYFLNVKSGELLRIVQEDVIQVYALLMVLIGMASETLIALALAVTIFIADPLMTVTFAALISATFLIISKVIRPILTKKGVEWQKHGALSNKWLLQGINGIKEIKVARKEEYFEKSFSYSAGKTANAEKWSALLNHFPRLLIEMMSMCSMLGLIGIMIFKGRALDELMPTLAAFAMAAVRLMPAANRIVGAINQVAYHEPSLDKLLDNIEMFETKKDKTEVKGKHAGKKAQSGMFTLKKEILLKNINYHYPNSEEDVLSGAGMRIPAGKSVGIVGASGAGKTTAVDILLGLLAPQDGEILVDGVLVTDEHKKAWLSSIGYIPQSIFMLDDTIRANVAFGIDKDDVSEERLGYALREAQLEEFVKGLPEGTDTEIGERGVRLSGGQRQRIGIARALYTNPELIIFDEATSALDSETEAAIMESINSLRGKKTLVIIAHRLQTIAGCDMVYRVGEKKIERER